MKKTFMSFCLIITVVIATFLLSNCSGGNSSKNEYLSSLPGIAKNYSEKIKNLEKEIEESTDMEKALKLDKQRKDMRKEAEQAIEEFLLNNPITDVPFEQEADYQFTINKVWVESSTPKRINYRANVTITEDILNDYGNPPGFKKNFFAYVIAVDKEGNALTRKKGTFMNATKKPFKANIEVEIYGSLDGPADLVNFEKLVFVSKDYNTPKK
ncbi:MAG: hypothetical protein QM503_11960 [Bacteroidota bacterium]